MSQESISAPRFRSFPAARPFLLYAAGATALCGAALVLVHLETLRGHSSFTGKGLIVVGVPYLLLLLGIAAVALRSPLLDVTAAGIHPSTVWRELLRRSGRHVASRAAVPWEEIERLELRLELLPSKDVRLRFEVASPGGSVHVSSRQPHAFEILETVLARRPQLAMDAATRAVLASYLCLRSARKLEHEVRCALLRFSQGRALCQVYWAGGWFEQIRRTTELREAFVAGLPDALATLAAARWTTGDEGST